MPKFELKFYRTYGQYAYEIIEAANESEAMDIGEALAEGERITNTDGEVITEDDLVWDEEDDGGVIEGPRLSAVKKSR